MSRTVMFEPPVSPRAGLHASRDMPVSPAFLEWECFARKPHADDSREIVSVSERGHCGPALSGTFNEANHRLRRENYVNVIVPDKQMHLRYMDMDPDQGCDPGVVPAINNEIVRFSLATDVNEHGVDRPEIASWEWPC